MDNQSAIASKLLSAGRPAPRLELILKSSQLDAEFMPLASKNDSIQLATLHFIGDLVLEGSHYVRTYPLDTGASADLATFCGISVSKIETLIPADSDDSVLFWKQEMLRGLALAFQDTPRMPRQCRLFLS